MIVEGTKIFFFKIPMGKWKNFFAIYRKFGHALSNRFANHDLEYGSRILPGLSVSFLKCFINAANLQYFL